VGAPELSAVADAGPLIHLAEIDSLSFLSIFGELHVPGTVWNEATRAGRASEAQISKSAEILHHAVSPEETERFVVERKLSQLHQGEREGLFLCMQLNVSVILTDDLAVRDAASKLGLTPIGSLGILMKACVKGLTSYDDAERRILELHGSSTLFVTRTIVDLALERLRESLI